MGIVDGEVVMDITAQIETKGGHDLVKGLIVGKHCTDSNPGDG